MTNHGITAIKENQFLESELTLSDSDYSQAVKYLVNHALNDTSGSRAAAQVLLSLYDGSQWHMDLTDLCVMDYPLLYQALLVIRGRTVLNKEPHEMIENGQQVFSEIQENWQQLRIANRYNVGEKE